MIKSYLHRWLSHHTQQMTLTAAEHKHACVFVVCCHLSEEPVELHAFGCSVAALNEARSAIHVHQALVVVIIHRGTEEPNVKLLTTGVVHVLQKTPHPALNKLYNVVQSITIQAIKYPANEVCSWLLYE